MDCFLAEAILPYEHGNELSGSINCWAVLEKPSDWRHIKKLGSMALIS
jgi:hypothetical protein